MTHFDSRDLRTQLNAAQYEAVTTTEGPLLVIAGAGSGKTRVIEFRSLYLVQMGVAPESILLLTFTRRSALEMIQRAARNDHRCAKIEGGTFHSFASKILRRYSRHVGLSGSFTIYDEGDAEEAIRRCCNKMGYDQDKEFPKKDQLKSMFSVCVNKGMTVDAAVKRMYGGYDDRLDEIRTVQHEYGAYKRKSNCLDYDDLLIYLGNLLGNEEVRESITKEYRYIMVDEYQDTNGIQAEIVRLLANRDRNIMAVGDDAQSIYGFRGANHHNILHFPTLFPEAKVIKLEENYRSTQSILDLSNAVLANMREKFDKRLVSATHMEGKKPSLRRFEDIYQEALWVAERLRTFAARRTAMRDIAVLFRTAYTSMPLQAELIKRGVRFKLFGGRKFYETAHVRDVLSYLRIAVNPTDELAWHRVLMLLPGIGPRTVERLLELLSGHADLSTIIDKVISPFCTGQKHSATLVEFRDLLATVGSATLAPSQQLDHVIRHYNPIMKARYKKDATRTRELIMLKSMAQRYRSLKEFLADVSVDPDKDDQDESEYLTLSTVHSAKGLEWPHVFLIGLVDGVFPSSRSLMDAEPSEVAEEERLLYVAVTRAKENLFMSLYHKGSDEELTDSVCRFLEPENVKSAIDKQDLSPAFERLAARQPRSRQR